MFARKRHAVHSAVRMSRQAQVCRQAYSAAQATRTPERFPGAALRAAAGDSPVVVCDLISCLLRSERSCELLCAVLHSCIERIVEPEAEEATLGGSDRAGMRRGTFNQSFGGTSEKAGLGDDVGDAVRR